MFHDKNILKMHGHRKGWGHRVGPSPPPPPPPSIPNSSKLFSKVNGLKHIIRPSKCTRLHHLKMKLSKFLLREGTPLRHPPHLVSGTSGFIHSPNDTPQARSQGVHRVCTHPLPRTPSPPHTHPKLPLNSKFIKTPQQTSWPKTHK